MVTIAAIRPGPQRHSRQPRPLDDDPAAAGPYRRQNGGNCQGQERRQPCVRQEPAQAVDHGVLAERPPEKGGQAARLQHRTQTVPDLPLWLVLVCFKVVYEYQVQHPVNEQRHPERRAHHGPGVRVPKQPGHADAGEPAVHQPEDHRQFGRD